MFDFDPALFLAAYRDSLGALTPRQSDGLTSLLTNVSADGRWTSAPALAYFLATVKWETAHTFQPVRERGTDAYFTARYGPHTPVGKSLGNRAESDGCLYSGRGYVQITGRANYARVGSLIGQDLAANPDLALDPQVAYAIASGGMHNGWFTGRKLSHYFAPGAPPNYEQARRIINGTDKAAEIAQIARSFATLLAKAALFSPSLAKAS